MASNARFHFALTTPPGAGGFAIFDLWGRAAEAALASVFHAARGLPELGASRLGSLRDECGRELDEVLVTRMAAESCWTGLETWTLSIHGGEWLQLRCAEALEALGGARLDLRGALEHAVAEKGLDAVQAAAFEALLECRSDRAAEFLCRQHRGELSGELRACLRLLDEGADQEDRLDRRLDALVEGARAARRLVRPLRVLLTGRPNSGKSTLFNRLSERERVVVSPRAGTTRDLVVETIVVDGFPIEIVDSAGVHDAPQDDVEREAIRRAAAVATDGRILLVAPPWDDAERALRRSAADDSRLVVANFADVEPPPAAPGFDLVISALTGLGVDELLSAAVERWIGPPSAELPCAPFTDAQIACVVAAARAARERTPAALDDVRRQLVHCLRSSWPHAEVATGDP